MGFYGNEPVPVVGVSPSDAPLVCLSFHEDWTPIIIGLLEFGLWPYFWDEESGDTELARTHVQEMIASLQECEPVIRVVVIKDVKPANTYGGDAVVGLNRRDLNTVEGDTELVQLLTKNFKLIAGTYLIHASVPARQVNKHQAILYGTDPIGYFLPGTSQKLNASDGENDDGVSNINGVFYTNGESWISILSYCQSAFAVAGLGTNCPNGEPEVYTQITLTRLGD